MVGTTCTDVVLLKYRENEKSSAESRDHCSRHGSVHQQLVTGQYIVVVFVCEVETDIYPARKPTKTNFRMLDC